MDLGCGDCRWLVAARRHCRRLVGYDIDGALLAKGRAALDGADHTLVEADFFESENIFEDGDVVVAYLFREGCAKLRAKLERSCGAGPWSASASSCGAGGVVLSVAAGGLVARVYEVRGESSPISEDMMIAPSTTVAVADRSSPCRVPASQNVLFWRIIVHVPFQWQRRKSAPAAGNCRRAPCERSSHLAVVDRPVGAVRQNIQDARFCRRVMIADCRAMQK